MSYKPSGNIATSFIKNKDTSKTQKPKDILAIVEGYDHANHAIFARQVRNDDQPAKLIKAVVDSAHSNNFSTKMSGLHGNGNSKFNSSKNTPKFSGSVIDANMEKGIPVGDRIVLEKSSYLPSKVKINNEDCLNIVCEHVSHITSNDAKKSFQAIFTIESYSNGRLKSVQIWDKQAFDSEDLNSVEELAKELDQSSENYKNKVYMHGVGFQLRTIIPNGSNKDGKIYRVIDCTGPFDWHREESESDENGSKKVVPAHPVNGDDLRQNIEAYCDYVYGPKSKEKAGAFNDAILDEAIVEVMPYKIYVASDNDSLNAGDNPKHPINYLSKKRSRLSINDDIFIVGKNYATFGIVEITGDTFNTKTGVLDVKNLIKKLFYRNIGGNVHSFVRAFDGGKTAPHPDIDIMWDKTKNEKAELDVEDVDDAEVEADTVNRSNNKAQIAANTANNGNSASDDRSPVKAFDGTTGSDDDSDKFFRDLMSSAETAGNTKPANTATNEASNDTSKEAIPKEVIAKDVAPKETTQTKTESVTSRRRNRT